MRTATHRVVVAAVLLVVGTLSAAAQTAFTPHHIARVRNASSVTVSPDGSMVAYTLLVPRTPHVDEDGPAWEELHVVGADARSRPFVTGEVNVSAVRWTPDGRALSFLTRRGRDTTRSLYVLPVDGGEARRVLGHETDIAGYSWSPDGTQVAFTARESAPRTRRELEKKGFSQEAYEESVPFTRVHVAKLGDTTPPRVLALEGSASTILWSPAGTQLAVALAATPLVDDDLMARRVHVVDVQSGRSVANLGNPGKLGAVAWSADGRHLALVSAEDLNNPAAGRLLVAPAAGGPLRDVLPRYAGHVSAIAFRGNDTIVFIGDEGVETVLGEVKIDGTGRRTLVPAGGRAFSALEVSTNGRTAALLADAPVHPSEVFLLAAGAAAPVRLTDSNPWFAQMRFAKQEVMKCKARDGLELEGVLVRPLDEQPGRRYPLDPHRPRRPRVARSSTAG